MIDLPKCLSFRSLCVRRRHKYSLRGCLTLKISSTQCYETLTRRWLITNWRLRINAAKIKFMSQINKHTLFRIIRLISRSGTNRSKQMTKPIQWANHIDEKEVRRYLLLQACLNEGEKCSSYEDVGGFERKKQLKQGYK